jgi:hypothetical protein
MTRLAQWISPVIKSLARFGAHTRHNAKRIAVAAAFALMAGVGGIGHIAPNVGLGPQAAAAQTPVPLTIDTNTLLTQVNTWTGSLDDVVFLGVAISIAIALLTFIGAQILKAFKSGGG